jgi:DNA gyrase subunit A
MVIRTRVDSMRTIGRNTQGVRLIKLDEGDTVSSLAKLPRDELPDAEGAALEPADNGDGNGDGRPVDAGLDDANGLAADPSDLGDLHRPHILDDGVGDAEASDHID